VPSVLVPGVIVRVNVSIHGYYSTKLRGAVSILYRALEISLIIFKCAAVRIHELHVLHGLPPPMICSAPPRPIAFASTSTVPTTATGVSQSEVQVSDLAPVAAGGPGPAATESTPLPTVHWATPPSVAFASTSTTMTPFSYVGKSDLPSTNLAPITPAGPGPSKVFGPPHGVFTSGSAPVSSKFFCSFYLPVGIQATSPPSRLIPH
jgi:hypothetical protein